MLESFWFCCSLVVGLSRTSWQYPEEGTVTEAARIPTKHKAFLSKGSCILQRAILRTIFTLSPLLTDARKTGKCCTDPPYGDDVQFLDGSGSATVD